MNKIAKKSLITGLILTTLFSFTNSKIDASNGSRIKDKSNQTINVVVAPSELYISELKITFNSLPPRKYKYSKKEYGNYYQGYLYLNEYVQDDEGRYLGIYSGYLYK